MHAPRLARFALSLCLVYAARAQFSSLATTDDGSTAYFATSFRPTGTSGSSSWKIFIADGNGMRLFADQFPGYPAGADLGTPQVSGDGSVVAYSGTYSTSQCGPHVVFCSTPPLIHYGTLIGPAKTGQIVMDGLARLSGNGRYALVSGPALLDVAAGTTTSIPVTAEAFTGLGVASDGSVLFTVLGQFFLWRSDTGARPVPVPQGAYAQFDDSATEVVYSVTHRNSGDPRDWTYTLYALDLAGGASRILANGVPSSISRDGRWIAFLSPGAGVSQAWVVRSDGEGLRRITDEPAGVSWATISGGGNVVYATTTSNRLLKIELEGGGTVEMSPPVVVPSLPDPYAIVVPGSQHSLNMSGLVTQTFTATPPLPAELGGIRVLVNGVPAPLFAVSPSEVRYQIPWETPTGPTVVVDVPGAVFESPVTLPLAYFAPAFETQPCTGPTGQCIRAAHTDTGAAVSPDKPARAGESIDLYLHGLGSVLPPVANGAAAPADPPAIVQHAVNCWLEQVSQPPPPPPTQMMPVLSAKLAPGTVGIYAVTVKFAAQVPFNLSSVKCASPEGIGGTASGSLFSQRNMF